MPTDHPGLLVAVIGLALRSLLSDLFNGISLPVKVDSKAYEISREVLAERRIAIAPKLDDGSTQMEQRETLARQILGGIVTVSRLPVKGRSYSPTV